MFKKEFINAFKYLKKNFEPIIPFFLESVVVFMFLSMISSIYFQTNIAEEIIQRVIRDLPFILSIFLLLLIVIGFTEASGLGHVCAFIKKQKNRRFWKYGNYFWFRMIKITFLTVFIVGFANIPAGFFLNYLLFSNNTLPLILVVFYIVFINIFIALGMKFSKFILIAEDIGVFESVKQSFNLLFSKPKQVVVAVLMSLLVTLPVNFISNFSRILGILLTAFFSLAWSANFFFLIYFRIKHDKNKMHNKSERRSKKIIGKHNRKTP